MSNVTYVHGQERHVAEPHPHVPRTTEGLGRGRYRRGVTMDARKTKRLEAAGWRVGSTAEFLGLSEAESALIEMRRALSRSLKVRRIKRGVTQTVLARHLRSSQSRVAKMEAGDPSVSLELLIRALLIVGASRKEVGGWLSGSWTSAR